MASNRCRWCGVELQGGFRFCPNCGRPIASPKPVTRPPGPLGEVDASRLRWLPFLFAAGAIFWLVELAQFAAIVIAPAGREQLNQTLTQAGFSGDQTTLLIADITIVLFIEISAAALHATAYFGLKARRPWGWIAAVVVSGFWSLILLGIPVLVLLLRRTTRHAYGIS